MNTTAERIEQALNTHHHRWDVYATPAGLTVAGFLRQQLPHIPAANWDELLSFAGLFVNGRSLAPDQVIICPARIELYEPKVSVADCLAHYNSFQPDKNILFDQSGLIVVYKPPRLHTMPAKEQKLCSLKAALVAHYKTEIHMPSRLDFSTQGLVLASRAPASHDYAQQLFQQRRIDKYYLFATSHKPNFSTTTVDAAIGNDARHAVLRKVVKKGGQPATTQFTYLSETIDGKHVVLAQPRTGRTHQIRVHAAHLELPLIGDNFYNGARSPSLHLLCLGLRFPLPEQKHTVLVQAPERLLPDWAQQLVDLQTTP